MEPYSKKQIQKIRKNFDDVERNQIPLFLLYVAQRRYDILTKILPQCWIQLLFNYLSKKFTVSITKLADSNRPEIATMLWNDKIIDTVYFTPPQSNISTLQQFHLTYFQTKFNFDISNRCYVNYTTIWATHSIGRYD